MMWRKIRNFIRMHNQMDTELKIFSRQPIANLVCTLFLDISAIAECFFSRYQSCSNKKKSKESENIKITYIAAADSAHFLSLSRSL